MDLQTFQSLFSPFSVYINAKKINLLTRYGQGIYNKVFPTAALRFRKVKSITRKSSKQWFNFVISKAI